MDITIVISWTFEKAQAAISNIGRGQFGGMPEKAAALLLKTWGVG